MTSEITGILREWRVFTSYAGKVHVEGLIYGDAKGRFANGTWVITSEVVELLLSSRTLITRNSRYALDGPANPTPGEYRK